MTHRTPSAPDPASSGSTSSGASRDALGFVVAPVGSPHRSSARIAVVLLALIVAAAVILNVTTYQTTRMRLVSEIRARIDRDAENRHREIRAVLAQLERDAVLVGSDLAGRGGDDVGRRLERASRALGLKAVELVGASGSTLAAYGPILDPRATPEVVARARATGRSAARVVTPPSRGEPGAPGLQTTEIVMAVPVGGSRRPTAQTVAVMHVSTEALLLSTLAGAPPTSVHGGAYLSGIEGDQVVILSVTPPGSGLARGERVSAASATGRAAWSAAHNDNRQIEINGAPDGPLWSATRYVPELGVGLVVQADRTELLRGIQTTLGALITLDLGVLLLAGSVAWFWRRRQAQGLMEREMTVAREQSARIQALFDNAFDAIVFFDGRGRVMSANRAALVMFQREDHEMLGMPIQSFLRWGVAGRPGAFEPMTLGTVTSSEALRADGTQLAVEYSLACAGKGDDLVYTAIIRDVSERLESEQRVQAFAEGLEIANRRLEEANAQLEEASRLKTEFLANTSHELRTPLNGMIGFLQLVLDGLCDSRDEERDFLNQALQCSRHLLGLINDVLDIAKIEAGKLSLDIEAVDVAAMFGEVYTLTHVQAAQKGITLQFVPPPLPTSVRGDFGKIKQVLVNLVGNSLKFTARGSIVVRATEHRDLGHTMFEVVDTGIGIPVERQKVIFEKFTQGDGSATRKYGGAGLGLAISRSLVELMGGIIGVHSEGDAKGTRMFFSIPVWREDEEAVEPNEPESDQIAGPSGGPLVLIVEDDRVFRRFLVELLHRNGYRTVETPHAEGGWMLATRLMPSTILLDYALSSPADASMRTGWDLAERLAGDPRTRHVPVIFLTGFESEVKERLAASTFGRRPEHLTKPVEGSVLIQRMRQILDERDGQVARVLLADDDPMVAAYVRKVLPEDRYRLEVVNNGEECLHVLRMQPKGYDLLLLDLTMPDVSGYDVLRRLALNPSTARLPVLVLTNYPEARTDEERRLLEQELVLEVIAKSAVHENPQMLAHVLDWHMQVASENRSQDETGESPGKRRAA
jgi:PAS domain S-box-containing protein